MRAAGFGSSGKIQHQSCQPQTRVRNDYDQIRFYAAAFHAQIISGERRRLSETYLSRCGPSLSVFCKPKKKKENLRRKARPTQLGKVRRLWQRVLSAGGSQTYGESCRQGVGVSLLTLISPLIRTFDLESGLSCLSATESGNCIVILGNAHVFFVCFTCLTTVGSYFHAQC